MMMVVLIRPFHVTISCLFLLSSTAFATFHKDVVNHVERGVRNAFVKKELQDKLNGDLLSKAIPLAEYEARLGKNTQLDYNQFERHMQEGYDIDEENMYSFSGYSLKYAKCQPVKKFSEDAIANGDYSPMVTEDIVILRLCPYQSCSTSAQFGCHYNYAEYAIGVSDYIHIMLLYAEEKKENMCEWCRECSEGNGGRRLEDADAEEENAEEEDAGNDDVEEEENEEEEGSQDENDQYANEACYTYYSYCEEYYDVCNEEENADDDGNANYNNYIDSDEYINYVDCVEIADSYGDIYYTRPRCDAYDETITMGLYYNDECTKYAGDEVSMSDFEVQFNNSVFESFYDGSCVDCSESNYPPNFDTNSYMCNLIHNYGAQCITNMEYDLFDYQVDDSTECSFIESIRFGTYDEEGDISVKQSKNATAQVTILQKVGLVSSALFCCLLILYSCFLHHSMTNLLIKSLSHRELLPPSRHSKRRSPNPSRGSAKKGAAKKGGKFGKGGKRDDDEDDDEEWASPVPESQL